MGSAVLHTDVYYVMNYIIYEIHNDPVHKQNSSEGNTK